jgi:hypothetical protein
MASRHVVSRFIHYDDDAQAINGHIQTITWSIQNFTILIFISILRLLFELSLNFMKVETTLAIEFALEVNSFSL